MKIIKLNGNANEINNAIELLKNRSLPFDIMDKEFNVIDSLNKSKIVKVLSSSSSKKLSKKANKEIQKQLKIGLELVGIKQSSHGYGSFSDEIVLTLIFQ